MLNEYYVLIEPWAVYVKSGWYFVEQGGLTKEWGQRWIKVEAEDMEDARQKGVAIRDKLCAIVTKELEKES